MYTRRTLGGGICTYTSPLSIPALEAQCRELEAQVSELQVALKVVEGPTAVNVGRLVLDAVEARLGLRVEHVGEG